MSVELVKKFGVGCLVAGVLTVFAGFLGVGYAGAAANPSGNNGTVKIDGDSLDHDHDNDPHVGCEFFVQWYGFDAGTRTTTVTFTAQAPTGSGETLLADTFTFTGSGAGNDLDAQRSYDLTDALSGYTPQANQGFHVKLTVDNDGTHGSDSKHKVFWVDGCDDTETSSSESTSSSSTDSTSSSSSTDSTSSSSTDSTSSSSSTDSTSSSSTDSTSSSSSTDSTSSSSTESTSSSSSTGSTSSSSTDSSSSSSTASSSSVDNTSSSTDPTGSGSNSSASTSSSSTVVVSASTLTPTDDPQAAVLGTQVTRGTALPRTGIDPTTLLAIGSLLAFGGAALVASTARLRRRSHA